jgi:hypothetical protein
VYFEVEIVLLHTLMVKRNVGRGTPTKILFKTALSNQGGFSMRKFNKAIKARFWMCFNYTQIERSVIE